MLRLHQTHLLPCSPEWQYFHFKAAAGIKAAAVKPPDHRAATSTSRLAAASGGGGLALLDGFHYLLCEFVLDAEGVQLVALRLGRSRVVFGSESNVGNPPVQGGPEPFGETAVPLSKFPEIISGSWCRRMIQHQLQEPNLRQLQV